MHAGVAETRSELFHRPGGQAIRRLDEDRPPVIDDRFLQRDHASGPQIAQRATQRVERIRRIHEHETADDCIDGRAELGFPLC